MADRLRRRRGRMPKPFRRATDGASKSPVMAEKHRASDRASVSRDPTQRRGRPSFGYFPWATRKVTCATARNGSAKPKESGKQATPNQSAYAMTLLSQPTRAIPTHLSWFFPFHSRRDRRADSTCPCSRSAPQESEENSLPPPLRSKHLRPSRAFAL